MTKTITVFTLVCLFSIEKSNAQLERGNVIVGADLANLNLGLNKGSVTSISLTPSAQWLIKNNLAVGAYVNFGIITSKDYTITDYGVGALGRYYIVDQTVNMLKRGNWFLEANAGFQGENIKDGNSTNGLGLGFGPGYAYFITHNIALESLLKFDLNVGFGNTTTTSDLNLHFGFQIYLSGRDTVHDVKENER